MARLASGPVYCAVKVNSGDAKGKRWKRDNRAAGRADAERVYEVWSVCGIRWTYSLENRVTEREREHGEGDNAGDEVD